MEREDATEEEVVVRTLDSCLSLIKWRLRHSSRSRLQTGKFLLLFPSALFLCLNLLAQSVELKFHCRLEGTLLLLWNLKDDLQAIRINNYKEFSLSEQ
ncbi:hypothetical protein ACLOJK_011829 [Asimina triloba]